MHNHVDEVIGTQLSRRRQQILYGWNERLIFAGYIIVFDVVIFLFMVFYMIVTHSERKRILRRVGGHSFFYRETRINASPRPGHGKTLLIAMLLFQPHPSVLGHLIESDAFDGDGFVGSSLQNSRNLDWEDGRGLLSSEDGIDFVSLLARAESQHEDVVQDSDAGGDEEDGLQSAYLFALGADPVPARVDWSNYGALHDSVARTCNWHVDDLVAIHHVQHPPTDLQDLDIYVLIPQHHNDCRQGDVRVMVLVDIEFHEDTSFSLHVSRETRLVPHTIGRHGLLVYLDVVEYCRWKQDRCLVWINHEIWPLQAVNLKVLKHGDFLRVALPPTFLGVECESSTKDTAASMRRNTPRSYSSATDGADLLQRSKVLRHTDIDQIHIYTDGSYSSKDQIAAGAFVIFGTVGHHERRSFLGWKGGTIITDSNSPHFTAAREHSALEAEASALVWAHIWMLQSGLCLPFNFYFDSCAAGNAASGIWSCNPCWPQGGRLRELVQFSCGLRGSDQLRYEHVKAHSNQPCNEIADSIAKFSAQLVGSQDFEGLPAWRSFFDVGDTRLSWGWWFIKSAKKGSGLPAIGSEVQVWTTTDRHHLPTTKIRDLVNQETDVEKRSDMWLSLATLNVQTLSEYSPDEVPGGEHWRAALLREQVEARGVQVAGLQETRARDKLLIATSNFIRIIGGNPEGNGHHGCELWLSSTTPLGKLDDKVAMFGRDTVTVLCAEARLLVVRAQPAGLSFVFVVCHMPHEGTDQDIKDLWWAKLKDALDRYSRLGFCFILGDFNARIDIMNPPFVGARLNGEGSDNGDRMRTLVEDCSMWLPSTFDEWHSGNDWTWTHARGTHARLDYIVAPIRDDVSVCYTAMWTMTCSYPFYTGIASLSD